MAPTSRKRFSQASPATRVLEGLLLGIAAGGLALLLWATGSVDLLEYRTWDLRVRTFAAPAPSTDEIRLILLDQYSLDWARRENGLGWPWPRELYSLLVTYLHRAGARVVAFDVLYTEPSVYGVADDVVLAEVIASTGRFIGAMMRGEGEPLLPIPEIAEAATLLADVTAATDPDGLNRRAFLASPWNDGLLPSFGLAAYLVGTGSPVPRLARRRLDFVDFSVPLDEEGRAVLRYRGPTQTHKTVNAAAVMQSELRAAAGEAPLVPLDFFKDKYVLFGFSAPGLLDLRPSPVGAAYPGVEIHATVLDNLLAGDFAAEPPSAVSWMLVIGFGLLAGLVIRQCRDGRQSAAAFLFFAAAPIALGWAVYPAGLWLPIVGPLAGSLLALAGGMVVNYAGEGRQKRFIKDAFSQYLSPVVIERLVQDPGRLTLGGEKRPLSILFSDVQGFTGISERLDPERLTALLNAYLTEVTTVIYDHGGTIDKYEGDAVIAFWNAPLDLADHAEKAVRAGLEYQKRLAQIRPRLAEMSGGLSLVARIGINTGEVVIGNMGSNQRFNYTFFGDAGNLAARLEGLNKQFGTQFMVSRFTRDAAGDQPDIVYRELSRVAVVGKSEPVTVYEPMYRETFESRRPVLVAFERALGAYYGGDFATAMALFEGIRDDDPAAASYLRKVETLSRDPPPTWNGVWMATEK